MLRLASISVNEASPSQRMVLCLTAISQYTPNMRIRIAVKSLLGNGWEHAAKNSCLIIHRKGSKYNGMINEPADK